MNTARRAFTLIELLVVIAIIAILAAILFPVFAQAKIAAKKTVYISNHKQTGTAIQIYLGDYDDTYPLGMGQRPAPAYTWGIGVAHPVPADAITTAPWTTPERIAMAGQFVLNAMQPYSKNYGLFNLPVAQTTQVFADTYNPLQTPASVGIQFNGEFHNLPAASVPAPSTAVLLWQVQKIDIKGRGFASPALNCGGGDATGASSCVFNPGGAPGPVGPFGAVNDVFFVVDFTTTVWLFDKKMVASKADSSSKVVPYGTVIDPLVATPDGSLIDPWAIVGPQGQPEGFYNCGVGGPQDIISPQYVCYFRPDRIK